MREASEVLKDENVQRDVGTLISRAMMDNGIAPAVVIRTMNGFKDRIAEGAPVPEAVDLVASIQKASAAPALVDPNMTATSERDVVDIAAIVEATRAATFDRAIAVVDHAREEGETDLRVIRSRIETLRAVAPTDPDLTLAGFETEPVDGAGA